MTEIRFEKVWKEYGSRIILEDVDFSLADHEFLCIVGPSGVGKTTILRLLLSQEPPSRGRILIDGEPIAAEPTRDRGVVFQRYSVFPHRTVLANVTSGPNWAAAPFLGRRFGADRRRIEAKGLALLERVGLGSAAAQYPQQLSGGMQQRLALAQAIVNRPKVLLLDEPFGALDPATRKSMHSLVRELWSEHEMTIVMVTHDIPEAFHLGTRVVAVDRKRIDPQAQDRYGATITADFCVKPRIVRDNARFEARRLAANGPRELSP